MAEEKRQKVIEETERQMKQWWDCKHCRDGYYFNQYGDKLACPYCAGTGKRLNPRFSTIKAGYLEKR